MDYKPAPGSIFIVSELRDSSKWHDILATRNEAEAHVLLMKLGEKRKLEVFEARQPRRW